ncbi:glycosyltransferase [Rhodococcus hoagii]|nr:glycosyltransferase [Prescottella equi]
MTAPDDVPVAFDRLIFHQFDITKPSPGGIDSCLRGITRYAPEDATIGFVGVDASDGSSGHEIGQWERHEINGRVHWFLPVVRLDPADQKRRIPHAIRLVIGALRFHRRLGIPKRVQAHRMDVALVMSRVLRCPLSYFVHTQESGLTGTTSDSIWRRAGRVHASLERRVIERADQVVVFNEEYSGVVREWNPATIFSPTWFDPALILPSAEGPRRRRIVWVGRLERPKDPALALQAIEALDALDPVSRWELEVIGSGTLAPEIEAARLQLPSGLQDRILLPGRKAPADVATSMHAGDVFLMTSHKGYEGFPRVLVEALASGLPAVVTEGSDTGRLVRDGATGFVVDRDPTSIARAILEAVEIPREHACAAVAELSAPRVIDRIYDGSSYEGELTQSSRVTMEADEDGRFRVGEFTMFTGSANERDHRIAELVRESVPHLVVTANVDHVLNLIDDPDLREAYSMASLRLIDGAPVAKIARLLGLSDVHRHTGADLLPQLVEKSGTTGWRIVITGGSEGVSAAASARLERLYPVLLSSRSTSRGSRPSSIRARRRSSMSSSRWTQTSSFFASDRPNRRSGTHSGVMRSRLLSTWGQAPQSISRRDRRHVHQYRFNESGSNGHGVWCRNRDGSRTATS